MVNARFWPMRVVSRGESSWPPIGGSLGGSGFVRWRRDWLPRRCAIPRMWPWRRTPFRGWPPARRASAGLPRGFVVSPDGQRVVFLRSEWDVPSQSLLLYDVGSRTERLLADPATLLDGIRRAADGRGARPPGADAGRSSGIVAFSTDKEARAAFALSSRLFVVDLADEKPRGVSDDVDGHRPVPTRPVGAWPTPVTTVFTSWTSGRRQAAHRAGSRSTRPRCAGVWRSSRPPRSSPGPGLLAGA